MKKIERLRAVLAGQVPDRVPASFWFHFPDEQAHGEAAVKAHLDYYRQVNPDFLKIMNEHHYQFTVPVKNPGDWRKLKPAPLKSEFFQAQLDEIKQITDMLQGECLTTTTIFNPFSSGNHATGGLVTEHLKADPQSVHIGLATIAESLAEFSLACLEAGADGIYFAAQGGEANRFNEHEFLQFIKPHDLTVLNAIRAEGELNIIHICGANVRLHLYCNYPGQIFNWAVTPRGNLSLKSGKRLFNRPVLGGLDNRGVIVNGKPEEIEKAVHEVIRAAGPSDLIIGADCTLPTEIARENIRLAIEATGTYPTTDLKTHS
jgi:uroporphyrinogen decarboxylase